MLLDRTTLEDNSFGRALRVQMGVLGALMMRDIHTRYGRQNLGFVWLFVEPAVLGIFVALMRAFQTTVLPAGLNMFSFAVIGYVIYYVFRTIVGRAASSAEQNEPLLWHARVTIEDVMIARTILETAAVMIATAVFLVGIGVYFGIWPTSWVQIRAVQRCPEPGGESWMPQVPAERRRRADGGIPKRADI